MSVLLIKQKMLWVVASIITLALFSACRPDVETNGEDLDERLLAQLRAKAPGGDIIAFFVLPESNQFDRIPQDPRNPLTPDKITLGRMLFHETAIGSVPKVGQGMRTYSCASCHHAKAGFQACLAQGIGEGGNGFGLHGEGRTVDPLYPLDSVDVQPIRSPSAMNGAWQEIMLWNGQFGGVGLNAGTEAAWTPGTPKFNNYLGFQGLETQAIAGQKVHRLNIDPQWVNSLPKYKEMFDLAFPNVPANERYNRISAGLAIAAYERTLLSNTAPWQRWLRGTHTALSDEEKKGALLFFGKAGCADCHTGPALNSMTFHALGMGDLQNGNYGAINITDDKPEHKGRGGFTGRQEDLYKFKVPQLYNLKDSPFYGHGGTFSDLREIVAYKNKAVAQNPKVPSDKLSPYFKPLQLSDAEIDALTLFLEKSLYDPSLERYTPFSGLPSGLCFPNNDTKARVEQGCN